MGERERSRGEERGDQERQHQEGQDRPDRKTHRRHARANPPKNMHATQAPRGQRDATQHAQHDGPGDDVS